MLRFYLVVCALALIGQSVDGKSLNRVNSSDRSSRSSKELSVTSDQVRNQTIRNDIQHLLANYRKLRAKKSEADMRVIATVGLVSGALKLQDAMKGNLYRLADDLIDGFNASTPQRNMEKLLVIEETIGRDRASIEVMNGILEFARNTKNFDEFQKDMQRVLNEVSERLNAAVINECRDCVCIPSFYLYFRLYFCGNFIHSFSPILRFGKWPEQSCNRVIAKEACCDDRRFEQRST